MKKIILITGGSAGIGAATALLASKQGYVVCINYRQDLDSANSVVDEINEHGGEAFSIKADVSDERQVEEMFIMIDKKVGQITALVNNAAVIEPQQKVSEMNAIRLQKVFATNVIGSFICSKHAIKRMSIKNNGIGGSIVNVSSMAARLGSPFEYIDYAASKGAIDTFTIGLSKEVAAEGIRVNAVRPGLIHTDIHQKGGEPNRIKRLKDSIPMKRGGEPDEVAKAILWLLSAEASYITGALVDVSGGR